MNYRCAKQCYLGNEEPVKEEKYAHTFVGYGNHPAYEKKILYRIQDKKRIFEKGNVILREFLK